MVGGVVSVARRLTAMSTSLRSFASTYAQRPWTCLRRSRAMAGLAAVCVLALGATACSLKDARSQASVSASASATASREAALTPELKA